MRSLCCFSLDEKAEPEIAFLDVTLESVMRLVIKHVNTDPLFDWLVKAGHSLAEL